MVAFLLLARLSGLFTYQIVPSLGFMCQYYYNINSKYYNIVQYRTIY